jgi:hypothetical protein
MQLARSAIGQLFLKPRCLGSTASPAIAVRCRSPQPRFVQHRGASFFGHPGLASQTQERKPVHDDSWQLGEKCEFGA